MILQAEEDNRIRTVIAICESMISQMAGDKKPQVVIFNGRHPMAATDVAYLTNTIYISGGYFGLNFSDDEFAFVIAQEIARRALGHEDMIATLEFAMRGPEEFQAEQGREVLEKMIADGSWRSETRKYNEMNEYHAEFAALLQILNAGYDAHQAVSGYYQKMSVFPQLSEKKHVLGIITGREPLTQGRYDWLMSSLPSEKRQQMVHRAAETIRAGYFERTSTAVWTWFQNKFSWYCLTHDVQKLSFYINVLSMVGWIKPNSSQQVGGDEKERDETRR